DPTSADANYHNLNAVDVADVIANMTDNDSAGITLSTIAITEGAAGVAMDALLFSEPTGDVTITFTPDAQCALSTNTLTFTGSAGAAPWNIPQQVTVTAVDDAVAEGTHTCMISYTSTSSDANYTFAATNHNVAVTDNDSNGITLSTITITEGAAGVAMDVVLLSDPIGDVSLTFTPNAQCTLNPMTLTFTDSVGAAPWNIAQQVTVTAVDDALAEGAHTCMITYSAASSDANYTIAATNHTVAVVDNDTPGIFLATVTVVEGGAGVDLDVQLFTQPTGDVTITFTPNAQCTLNPMTLTFTDSVGAAPWNIAQQVTVTAVDDLIVETSQHDCVLSVSSTSADANYNGLIAAYPVTVRDNDSEAAPAVPAETFLCGNLRQQTNGAMTGSGDIGNVALNGVYGNTYCSVLVLNGEYRRNPAEIGNASMVGQGVVQALDVYGLLPDGVSVVPFQTPAQICFAGSGSVYFLSSFGSNPTPIQLPQLTSSSAGYTCVGVPNAGKVVLTSTPSSLQPAQTTSTILAPGVCQVTTTFAVRLRATPDVSSDTNVIATLPFDLTLVATEYVPDWYRVIYQNGQGWVSDQYLTTRGNC
ncbi:MAG: SH3 domain-containing protein, partial [Anaerolineae bacterium]|nr:SH3 domain-containing protein [Anaerolineae bacterium]